MRLNTISGDDWREFAERFPSAQSFLLGASLRGELRGLLRDRERATIMATRGVDDATWTPTRAGRCRELEAWAAGGGA